MPIAVRAALLPLLLVLTWIPPVRAASRQPVFSQNGLVASTSDYASEVGASLLKAGGNAADAAVGVGLALAVTWPAAGNLGGGGFALLRTSAGEAYFIDYREAAPAAAGKDFFLDAKGELVKNASSVGYRAVAIPGTPAGLELIHKRWGKLPWSRVVEPARRLAAQGYRLEPSHIRILKSNQELLAGFPSSRDIFLKKGEVPEVGELFVQKDLARSLALLQKEGARSFYRGTLSRQLLADFRLHGGVITAADLAGYTVQLREPLRGHYGDFELISAPPPSSGGAVLLEMLGMLVKDDLKGLGYGSASYIHLLVESMKRAFADRAEWFADPQFSKTPLVQLLDGATLARRRAGFDMKKATPSSAIHALTPVGEEKPETTHFTIVDAQGMIVSNTYTLNGSFGSGATATGTGILLNNEMDDFAAKPGSPNMYGLIQSTRNAIAPGKRPLSSMSPTIVLKDGQVRLSLGSPGGPTIINTVLQVTLNALVHGMNIQEAVDAPRIHHQWLPDEILWEPQGLNPDTRQLLEGMGHQLSKKPRFMGDAQALLYDPERKEWSGASDSRWGGAVAKP